MLFLLFSTIAVHAQETDESTTETPSQVLDLDTELGKKGETRGINLEVDEYTQEKYPLLYSGMDKQLAINHVLLADNQKMDAIQAERFSVETQNASPKILGSDAILIQCPNSRSSMSRIRMLYQKGNNALNYYELEKAEEYLSQAAADILCLKDPVEVETISNIYFLSGIVNVENGKIDEGYANFKRALTFTPNFQWVSNFAPDLRVQFDKAAKDLAAESERQIIIYPESARKNVLINGQEVHNEHGGVVNVGMNVIQIFGEEVNTYFLQVGSDTRSLDLIVPAALPQDALTWIDNEQSSLELALCFEGMYSSDTQLYLHDQGTVYSHIVGSDSWSTLEISSLEKSTLWLRSEKFAKTLQIGGIGLFAVAGGVSATNVILAHHYNNQAKSTDTFPVYDDNRTKYNNVADGHNVWLASTLVGLGLTGVGFALSF